MPSTEKGSVLRLIEHSMKIDPVDGTQLFIHSNLFFYRLGKFFNEYHGAVVEPTPETRVHGLLVTKPATFKRMFSELSADISKLAFTEHQIINFIGNNRAWMTHGATTYFLFKYNHGVVVASIFPKHDETSFGIDVYNVDYSAEWHSPLGIYLVAPVH